MDLFGVPFPKNLQVNYQCFSQEYHEYNVCLYITYSKDYIISANRTNSIFCQNFYIKYTKRSKIFGEGQVPRLFHFLWTPMTRTLVCEYIVRSRE